MTQEIMQESNPELKDLSLFCLTKPMHIIMKFHTKREYYKTLWGWGVGAGKISRLPMKVQNENGNIMASNFSLATLEGRR